MLHLRWVPIWFTFASVSLAVLIEIKARIDQPARSDEGAGRTCFSLNFHRTGEG
jgi:hypothetical protein